MAKEKDLQKIQQASGVTSDTTVRMVDASGNSVQIGRDVFMQAIRDVLPSVLSDQGTNATKVSTLNSSNVLGTSTIANLASVLGVKVFTDNNQTRICSYAPDKALYLGRYTVMNYTTITFSITSSVPGLKDSEQVVTTMVYATKREPSVNAILRVDKVNQTFELYYTNINDNTIDVFVASKRGAGVNVGLLLVGFSTVSDRATADVKALTLATTEGV